MFVTVMELCAQLLSVRTHAYAALLCSIVGPALETVLCCADTCVKVCWTLRTGALAEFEASATVLSQAAAALQSRALVYVYSCNMGAAIQVRCHAQCSPNSDHAVNPILPILSCLLLY